MTQNTNPTNSGGTYSTTQSVAEIDQRIAEAYATGGSIQALAIAHGLTSMRIRDAILRTGGQLRGRGRASGTPAPTAAVKEQIVALFDAGYRTDHIANKTNLTIQRVRVVLRNQGRCHRRTRNAGKARQGVPA